MKNFLIATFVFFALNNSFTEGVEIKTISTWTDVSYKYIVLLFGDSAICTGALANENTVYTSAHCVCDYQTIKRIRVGATDTGREGYTRMILERFLLHNKHSCTNGNFIKAINDPSGTDLAALKIIPVDTTWDVAYLKYSADPEKNTQVILAGYGSQSLEETEGKYIGVCNRGTITDDALCVEIDGHGDFGFAGLMVDAQDPSQAYGVLSGYFEDHTNVVVAYSSLSKHDNFLKLYLS